MVAAAAATVGVAAAGACAASLGAAFLGTEVIRQRFCRGAALPAAAAAAAATAATAVVLPLSRLLLLLLPLLILLEIRHWTFDFVFDFGIAIRDDYTPNVSTCARLFLPRFL